MRTIAECGKALRTNFGRGSSEEVPLNATLAKIKQNLTPGGG